MKNKSNMDNKASEKQVYERELTLCESMFSMFMVVVIFLLCSIDENKEWQATEWVRMGIALGLGVVTIALQLKWRRTPLNEEDKQHGK